ncbi:unnamed protein product, partial [Amoebophrya sp. A25]
VLVDPKEVDVSFLRDADRDRDEDKEADMSTKKAIKFKRTAPLSSNPSVERGEQETPPNSEELRVRKLYHEQLSDPCEKALILPSFIFEIFPVAELGRRTGGEVDLLSVFLRGEQEK